jgi:hypothetical protein
MLAQQGAAPAWLLLAAPAGPPGSMHTMPSYATVYGQLPLGPAGLTDRAPCHDCAFRMPPCALSLRQRLSHIPLLTNCSSRHRAPAAVIRH